MTDATLRTRFRDFLQRLAARRGEEISEDWIQALVEAGEEEGIIAKDENEMIQGIFDLRDTVVREVMVPRPQVAALPAEATLEEFLALLAREGHSRVPVYEGNLDNVVGIVYSKDLLKHWGRDPKDLRVREVVRAPHFVPDTKRVKDLLHELRRSRVHIAVVVDEYGATAGIVTIEDLIEEIVGEIRDEYDAAEEDPVKRLEDGSLSVDPRVNLSDLEDVAETRLPAEIPREEFDTVGGLIFHLAGRLPRQGETLRAGDLALTVERATERRLMRVRVRVAPALAGAPASATAPGPHPSAVAGGDARAGAPPEGRTPGAADQGGAEPAGAEARGGDEESGPDRSAAAQAGTRSEPATPDEGAAPTTARERGRRGGRGASRA